MDENKARTVGAILSALIVAGTLWGIVQFERIMRQVRDDQRAFQAALLEQHDMGKWAAEVDQAREAPD